MTMGRNWKMLAVFLCAHLVSSGVVGQLEELVLGGNYGSSLNNVPNLREIRDGKKSVEEDQSLGSLVELDEDGIEVEISGGDAKLTKILEVYGINRERRRQKILKLSRALSKTPTPNAACVASCESAQVRKHLCYIQCVVTKKGYSKELKMLVDVVADTVTFFCKPLRTKVNSLFSTKPDRELNTFKSFLDAANIHDKQTLSYARGLLTYAVIGSIVKSSFHDTPYSPLRPLIFILLRALNKEFPSNTYGIQENPDCDEINLIEAFDFLLLALKTEDSLYNIFLPGLVLVNSVSKYISVRSSVRMTALMELHRMASGSGSGFLCRPNNKGHPPPDLCDELGDYLYLEFPVPPIPGLTSTYMSVMDPVCGKDDEGTVKLDLPSKEEETVEPKGKSRKSKNKRKKRSYKVKKY